MKASGWAWKDRFLAQARYVSTFLMFFVAAGYVSVIMDGIKTTEWEESPSTNDVPADTDSEFTDGEISSNGSELGVPKDLQYNRSLFRAASRYIKPSRFFRFIVYLYGERKMLVFFWLHFIATMTIWVHFGLIKFEEQKETVPEGAPFYWWKRVVPPLEFGSMHAILFQMALLPLTMSRYSIAALSGSVVDRFVPLNRALRMHIHLGYVMVGIVFFATVFFLLFFGLLCANGDEAFCDKFTSEIMCTGYGIMASLLIIGGTSYFRNRIPYEVFYIVHHLVFAMYAITVAHTFDNVQRDNARNRSQTFKWFSTTILFYVCDRMAMRLNHKYRARVVSATAVRGTDGSRMLLVKLQRPVLFEFQAGQYAFLKQSSIATKMDNQWHPFSIASGPSSRYLEFYIEVFEPHTWTGRLWELFKGDGSKSLVNQYIEMDIMGPYGTALAKSKNFSHGLVIGAGTGIVPVLSMWGEHVENLSKVSPKEYLQAVEERNLLQTEYELARDAQKGSIAKRFLTLCKRKPHYEVVIDRTRTDKMQMSIRSSITKLEDIGQEKRKTSSELKWAAANVSRSIYGTLFLAFVLVFGVTVFALTISWNTISIEIYDGMKTVLKVLTVGFQTCFAIPAVFVWDGNNLFSFFDFSMIIVAVIGDYFWFQKYDKEGVLSGADITLCSLLTAYMIGRIWVRTVYPRSTSRRQGGMRRLQVVWVSRSASLIAEIFPDIEKVYNSMVDKWGHEDAMKVCRFSIFCTDKEEKSIQQLKADLGKSSLYRRGFVKFGRPDFNRIIEDHTLEVIDESRTSNTLLAFCGSSKLAEIIHQYQVSSYMMAAVTGYKKHTFECVSETYGGTRKFKPRCDKSNEDSPECDPDLVPQPTLRSNFLISGPSDPENHHSMEMLEDEASSVEVTLEQQQD